MAIKTGILGVAMAIALCVPQMTSAQELPIFNEGASGEASMNAETLFDGTNFVAQADNAQPAKEPPAEDMTAIQTISEKLSVFFTDWERAAIANAKALRGMVRSVSDSEMQTTGLYDDMPRPKPPPEARNITLNGIVYNAYNDWTIWLNGKRITPDALPKEAIDLKVYKEYIEVEWYDDYTNRVLPIRLRANQRFNVDTRIFLPG